MFGWVVGHSVCFVNDSGSEQLNLDYHPVGSVEVCGWVHLGHLAKAVSAHVAHSLTVN